MPGSFTKAISAGLALMLLCAGGVYAQSQPAGSAAGPDDKSQLLVASPDHARSMEELLEAAQKLREAIQSLAQQPPGPKRQAAIDAAYDALLSTQRTMLQLPPELRIEGREVHLATEWPKAMARLKEAADGLRESIEAMGKQPAGKERDEAIATAHRALMETHQAMLTLPNSDGLQ